MSSARKSPMANLQGSNQSLNSRRLSQGRNQRETDGDLKLERMDGAKDPLRLDGEFSQREKTFWSPGDQVRPFKREDNLRMEGDFTLRREEGQGSKEKNIGHFGREEIIKRGDNIKLVGEFPKRERMAWCPGDQVIPCNRQDNLRLEGEFGQEREVLRYPAWGEARFGRTDSMKQNDEVELSRDDKVQSAGKRWSLSKMEDNLRREGEFCNEEKKEDILKWRGGVRQREDIGWNSEDMVGPNGKEERIPRKQEELRAKDNLRMEGEFSQREARTWNPGEKVEPFWRRDNLAMEGEFCRREDVLLQDENLRRSSTRRHVGTVEEGRLGVWDQGERVAKVVRPDNLSLR